MFIEIAGSDFPISRVYFREFKYGNDSYGWAVAPYRLVVTIAEIAEVLTGYYEDYAGDDSKFGFNATEVTLALRKLTWPPLLTLAAQHPEVLEHFLTENSYHALQALFAIQNLDQYEKYLINDVRAVTIRPPYAIFEGEVIDISTKLSE